MQAHVVTILPTGKKRYAASHTEAVQIRLALMKELDLLRNAIDISPVEIPSSKPDLLAWLNGHG